MSSYTIPLQANPRWANAEQTQIDIDVEFAGLDGSVRFTANPADAAAPYAAEIFSRALAGEFGSIEGFVPVSVPPEADWRGFLDALRPSSLFTALRDQARADVAANALATELRIQLGEAALGLPDAASIQALLDELWPSLTAPQQAELQGAIAAFNVPLATTAP